MATTYTRRISLYINGQEVKNDIASIKSEMNKLTAQQARMTRGSEEYVQAGAKIKLMRGIIQEHNNDLKGTTSLWDKLGKAGDNFNRYFAMFATFAAGFGGLLFAGKKAISTFAEFDDKVGDVMKTTGLAKDRVYAMNEELKKMDTRTAQNELLDLGKVAGKLGLSAEKDVMGFIRSADKINVALKEDLGGNAEEAINEVGKLVDIFKVKQKFGIEDSMLKVGSSINALGAASTANEGYIVEFTKRVAGIAPSAGVNIQAVMGLAATLDQLGQTSEVSSTVYSAVMTGMFKDTAMYARIAGLGVKDFGKLLKKDANEAFIQFLNGLQGNAGGMEELTAKMDGLGLEGKRSIAVLGVLANNTDILRESQRLSNVEFDKGTSLTNEFNVKNETAQAKLDKASKSLSNMTVELGQKLMPVLTVSTSGMSYFVKAVSVIADFLIKHSGAIITTTSTLVAYGVATKLSTLWTERNTAGTIINTVVIKAKSIATSAEIVVTQLYAAAQMLLAGNIKGATLALKEMFLFMKLSPIGLLVGGITLAVGAYLMLKDGISDTAKAGSEFYSSLVKQRAEMGNLFEIVKKTGEGTKERAEGINKINEVYGKYLPQLLTEKSTLNDINAAQIAANISLRESIVLKSKEKAMQKITDESLEKQLKYVEGITSIVEKEKGTGVAGLFQSDFNTLMETFNTTAEKDKHDVIKTIADKYKFDYLTLLQYSEKIAGIKNEEIKQTQRVDAFFEGFTRNKSAASILEEKIAKKRTELNRAETKEQKKAIQEEIDILEQRIKLKKEDEGNKGGETYVPGTPEPKKWNLNDDVLFLQAKAKLNDQFAKGSILSQEELDDQLLAIEILYLDKRIKTGKEKGAELANLNVELSDKKVKQRQDEMKREKALLDASKEGMSDIDKERFAYDQQLIDLKLYNKNVLDMTETELKAYMSLQKAHNDKMDELDAKAIKKEIDNKQAAYNSELNHMKVAHADELSNITTLEQAKALLSSTMSKKQLNEITTLGDAKKIIQENQSIEEQKLTKERLEDLLKILQDSVTNGDFKGIDLSDKILSEEEKKVLLAAIEEVYQSLGKLKPPEDAKADPKLKATQSVDLLGFSKDDWDIFFSNIENSKLSTQDLIETIYMGVSALGNVWQQYNAFVSAGEKRQLQEFEKNTNNKKESLKKQLDAGVISQEAYASAIDTLDKETEKKRAQYDHDSAIRDRNAALMGAIVNTAVAVTQALPNLILAALVGVAGGLQIATILATPVPEMPGEEEGGFINVVRSQDGKRFNAKNNPGKRGYVSTPTVITGENGTEWIAPAEAVGNPTIRPILDILEMSRQAGNLATLNLGAVMGATTLSGRSRGGSVTSTNSVYENASGAPAFRLSSASGGGSDNEMVDVLLKVSKVVENLQKKLDDPIKTYVNIHGTTGLAKKLDEYYSLEKNADI